VAALLLERRLPYRASVALDRLCNSIGLTKKTVKADGFRIRIRRLTCDESFVRNILVNHDYTPPGFDIHESDVVIDIGGNIGTFALTAARRACLGRVFCFEPNSENYQLLLRNIALNRAANIVPVRAAVSGSKGTIKLFLSAQGGFHSVREDRMRDPSRYEMVETVSLKDILDKHGIERCNFLKLDCEGAEYDILYNLPREYYSRIDKIAMEYHGDNDPEKRRIQSDRLAGHLENVGFRIETYQDFVGFDCGFIRAARCSGD
jgi:FkbM family methyltransferase